MGISENIGAVRCGDSFDFAVSPLLQKKHTVYTSPAVSTPMLIGIQKPQIVLPDRKYAEEELAFAKTLHWFNPAVFWMERQAVQDMELLCDGCVVRQFSREEKKAIWRGAVKLSFRENKQDGRFVYQ